MAEPVKLSHQVVTRGDTAFSKISARRRIQELADGRGKESDREASLDIVANDFESLCEKLKV